MTTIAQTKHNNKTIERIKAILFHHNICYTCLPYDRVISIQLYESKDFIIMQKLLPQSGNSAIGRAITHEPPFIPKYRPDRTVGAYRILLQCK